MMNWQQNKARVAGAFLVAFAAALWGMDGIVLTPRLYNLDVIFVVFVLHIIPFSVMNVFLFPRYKAIKKLQFSDLAALFFVALFGGAIGTWAIVKALFLVNFKSLSIVVLLQKLQPVFAIVLAHLLLKEELKRNFVRWASLALIAGYFLTFGWQIPHIDKNTNTILAALYAVLAAFSFGASTVFSKKILHKLDFITATFFRYGATSLLMFIIVLLTGHLFDFSQITATNWLIILIISLTSGSAAIFIYYYGLKKISAMLATIMELFFPITAILLDYFVNNHFLSPIQWFSAAVMIFAIIKLTREKN
jgi:drug/metabolite transporter (DMT)-like permease